MKWYLEQIFKRKENKARNEDKLFCENKLKEI